VGRGLKVKSGFVERSLRPVKGRMFGWRLHVFAAGGLKVLGGLLYLVVLKRFRTLSRHDRRFFIEMSLYVMILF